MEKTFQKLTIEEFEEYIKNYNFTRKIKEFHVHHTWKPNHTTLRKAKSYEAVIYSMYVYHTKTRGWQDIGQNITIDDNGDIWLCRDFNISPASIKGRNSNGFACEMIGNFDKGNDVLNGKQLNSLIRAIKSIQEKFNLDDNGVVFHREYSAKTCPGTSINKQWLLDLIDNYKEKSNYDLIKLENGQVVKGYKNNNDYYIKLNDVENLLKPLALVNYDNIHYDKPQIKESDIVVLRKGSRGVEVRKLQEKLTKLGYDVNGIDGIFGNGCDKTVRNFQRDYDLVIDGIVGRNTWKLIDELLKKKDNLVSTTKNYEILKPKKYITVVKIKRDAIKKADIILGRDNKSNINKLESQYHMYKRLLEKPTFMINGGLYYYDRNTKKASSLNLLFTNNNTYSIGVYSKQGLLMYPDGKLDFGKFKYTKGIQMIGGSPTIIRNGKIVLDKGKMENSLINNKHPRSAIGLNDDYLFIVAVDGRRPSKGYYGMTIYQLSKYMQHLGCTDVINLDGGGSTIIRSRNEVINNPTEYYRGLHNCLAFYIK